MKIYDISVLLAQETHVYPKDPPIQITSQSSITTGDEVNIASITINSHAGTHVDAPNHLNIQGMTIDEISLEVFIGPAFVAEISRTKGAITKEELERSVPKGTKRLLLKTINSSFWKKPETEKEFVTISSDAAKWIVQSGILLVGIDYISVEPFESKDLSVHHTLLDYGSMILEGLDLTAVPPGEYNLICLPLKIDNGDGAPVRAILTTD